ncbi:MAG: hypothetical protein HON90_06785 [Halobacteriovoraceae bacterium]|jgi:hypothetical protein|nr:hypothetical protein [Halobacteriovoraceae bacterium]
MLYEFSITDSNNYTKEQIANEALIVAQNEFDLLGVNEEPSITLISESTEENQKVYNFVAKKTSESSSNQGSSNSDSSSSETHQNGGFAASPSL